MRSRQIQLVVVLSAMALVAFTSVAVGTAAARAYSVTVTPDNSSSGTKFASTSGHTASFTITFIGDEMDDNETFDLWCSGSLGIQCSVQSTITLTPNIPENVDVTFSTSSQTGTGYVYLNALGWVTSFSDQGSRYYTVSAPVDVTSLSIPSTVVQHADDQEATFRVTNNGSGATFTMTCSWGAGPCASSPSSVYIGQGAQDTVTVTFDAGAIPATYEAKLTATAGANSDWASGNVTVTEFLSVNAVAQQAEVYAVPNVQRTDNFVVRFPGQSASAFAMSVACAGSLSGCSVNAADDTMNVGDTPVSVRVSYTAGGNGTTGTVTLTAAKVGSSWLAQAGSLEVIATSDILVSVDDANSGLEIDRGDCLTVAAGAGSIVCDDFQFVYPFTPVSRMNEARQLALIYNSDLKSPAGMVAVDFVLPPGVAEPDSIRATLVVNGVTKPSQYYGPALYAPGQKTRLALNLSDWTYTGENLLKYDVTLETKSGGSWGGPVTRSGKFLSLHHGTRYGRGWWIGGLEKLSVHGDTLIWTGADASGGVYIKSGTKWIRHTRSLPDTIVQSGSDYVRSPIGGGAVHFNSSGFHTKTFDRNGNETRFNYTTVANWLRLTSVQLPTPTALDTIYRLHYNSSSGVLDSVSVRTGAGSSDWRTYRIRGQNVVGHGLHIDSIVAPDGLQTGFITSYGRINEVRGPRGDTTVIAYSYEKVAGVTVKTLDVSDVVLGYQPSSVVGRGTSGWTAPRPTDSVSTRIDGPLSGAADTTRFFTTAWGGVRGIRDAGGATTWIDRSDPSFPALPTRVRHPNGWEATTAYNAVGLPDTIVDRSTGAVTTYEWNNTWAAPTRITSPEGVVTAFVYDGSGNRTKQAVGTDTVRFYYNADGLVDSIADPLLNKTRFGYDTYGNLSWEKTATGQLTRYAKDRLGRDTLVVSPTAAGDSIRARTVYDTMGRPTINARRNDLDAKWDSVVTTYTTGFRTRVEAVGGTTSAATDSTGASEWIYDGLGRVWVAKTPVSADTMTYDLAGRLTRTVSNGDTVSMGYDALGRLTSRRASRKFYSYGSTVNGWYFPVFETSGLTIDTMTATFSYDAMGNMLTANNAHARITRTYALNGALETDSLAIKNYGSGSFGTHQYRLVNHYDRDGRRVALGHPSWLSPGTDRTDYVYQEGTGRLASVTDALGDVYEFTYDAAGQLKVMEFPSGSDTLAYDADGRLGSIKVQTSEEPYLLADAITYDLAGRLSGSNAVDADYDGFGHLSESSTYREVGPAIEQYFTRDAFGNAVIEQSWSPVMGAPTTPGTKWIHTHPAREGGRLWMSDEDWDFGQIAEPTNWVAGQAERTYDLRGNLSSVYENRYTWTYSGGVEGYATASKVTNYRSYAKSYWSADGQLRVHQINRDSVDHRNAPNLGYGAPWGAYEEYWYDALGRRVLKRSRQESPICTDGNRCFSSIERVVWDGDQVLWEVRQSGAGDTQNPTHGEQSGYVGYVHAGGLDAPVGMIRNNTAVVLHRNARGLVAYATTDDGELIADEVYWPGINWDVKMGYIDTRDTRPWYGTLSMDNHDRTGLTYKRNRYYDASSGQFTQQDPIGIAGGLNLYGYANGDPINFSDPFGLCPVPWLCAAAIGGAAFGAARVTSNLLSGEPMMQGVTGDIWRGMAVGATFGLAAPAMLGGGAATSAADAVLFSGTRGAARTALAEGIEGVSSGQAANIARALGRGRVDQVSITQLSGGSISVAMERAGRQGSQVLTKVIDAAGRTTSMIQRAYDEAGNLTHFDPWVR